jgi:hypothetical protein
MVSKPTNCAPATVLLAVRFSKPNAASPDPMSGSIVEQIGARPGLLQLLSMQMVPLAQFAVLFCLPSLNE